MLLWDIADHDEDYTVQRSASDACLVTLLNGKRPLPAAKHTLVVLYANSDTGHIGKVTVRVKLEAEHVVYQHKQV